MKKIITSSPTVPSFNSVNYLLTDQTINIKKGYSKSYVVIYFSITFKMILYYPFNVDCIQPVDTFILKLHLKGGQKITSTSIFVHLWWIEIKSLFRDVFFMSMPSWRKMGSQSFLETLMKPSNSIFCEGVSFCLSYKLNDIKFMSHIYFNWFLGLVIQKP